MRLFIALPVPEEVKESILAETANLRDKYPSLKWVRREALHLTLRFLGEVEEKYLDDIGNAMGEAASKVPPFDMELRGLGTFPKKGAPRVVFLPLARGAEPARRLYQGLTKALGDIGKRDTKKFTPHLTLARVKGRPEVPDPSKEGEELAFSFTQKRLLLYRSHLDSRGACYEILREANLAYEME